MARRRAELRMKDLVGNTVQGWPWRVPGVWYLLPEWFAWIREPRFSVEVMGLWPDPTPQMALPDETDFLWEVVKGVAVRKG